MTAVMPTPEQMQQLTDAAANEPAPDNEQPYGIPDDNEADN